MSVQCPQCTRVFDGAGFEGLALYNCCCQCGSNRFHTYNIHVISLVIGGEYYNYYLCTAYCKNCGREQYLRPRAEMHYKCYTNQIVDGSLPVVGREAQGCKRICDYISISGQDRTLFFCLTEKYKETVQE